ncbi:MAG: hypothetical protein WA532_10305 [Candidatus Korobacteraceae bacterium]
MTKHKRLILGAMAIVLLSAASCKRQSGEKKFHPSPLAGGLYSGQSLQTAERKLDMMAGDFDVLVDRTPLPSDTRPPYRLLVISRKNSRIDGQPGELVLTFFNDRLMTSQFYTDDVTAARTAVETGDKLSLADGEAHIEPSTRVWVGKDENGRSYIGWIDKSLQAEQDAWIKQYGD